jgi:hypothetical protein
MTWRWLIGDFGDSHVVLSREQRREAHRRTTNALGWRLWAMSAVIGVPPVLLLMLVHGGTGWVAGVTGWSVMRVHTTLSAVVCVLTWPWSAWVYGHLYRRPYRRTLRRMGVRLCVGCGYSLERLDAGVRCPECGEREDAIMRA